MSQPTADGTKNVLTSPAPITRLPPELIVMVFEHLEKPEKTVCTLTRQRWLELMKNTPPFKTRPGDMLEWAAKRGSPTLIKFAKVWGAAQIYNHSDFILWGAAQGGHTKYMKLAKKSGATGFNLALEYAAEIGHINCMKLAKEWGARDFNAALSFAALGGQIVCIKLLKEWGATDFAWVLTSAADGGHINCMKLAKVWGATCFDEALEIAAEEGHTDCMKLAKKWGATDFDNASWKAAMHGHLECLKLARKWGGDDGSELIVAAAGGYTECMKLVKECGHCKYCITDFDAALVVAAGEDQIKSMKLLKKWGAKNFNGALLSASQGCHVGCLKLAKKWGATDFALALKKNDKIYFLFSCEFQTFIQSLRRNKEVCARLLHQWQDEFNKIAQ